MDMPLSLFLPCRRHRYAMPLFSRRRLRRCRHAATLPPLSPLLLITIDCRFFYTLNVAAPLYDYLLSPLR